MKMAVLRQTLHVLVITTLALGICCVARAGSSPAAPDGTGTAPRLSSKDQVFQDVFVARNVSVEMRDGTLLAADIYLPSRTDQVPTEKFPTLVERTPYGKDGEQGTAVFFAEHGYAVVVQDVRGRNASQGDFYPYINEAKDSYDTDVWAGKQSWSNGKVGTFGVSYSAATQLLLVHNPILPPDLVAMAPGYASASYYGDGAYVGGAFRAAHNLDYETRFAVAWYDRTHGTKEKSTPIKRAYEALNQLYWQIPLDPFKPVNATGLKVLEDYMQHYTYDDYWSKLNNIPYYRNLKLPMLSYSGWYDLFDQGMVQNYRGVADRADAQLVMGPYEHANESHRAQGMLSGEPYLFPENSTYSSSELDLAFFDQYLKGHGVQASTKSVRLYVPGAGFDSWVGADTFPLPQARATNYYLRSDGSASIKFVDQDHTAYNGTLTTERPKDPEPPDHYVYDPRHPVVTIEGYDEHWAGGVNEETMMYQDHQDILVYQTPPLEHDTAVVGPIAVTLYASTSATTTDFMVNLTDMNPLFSSMFVAEGARRGGIGDVSADPRNPKSYATVTPLVPGKVYKWEIAIWPTARVFAKGHRIRIDVTSSDFPHFNRNLNSEPSTAATKIVEAHQTIYHSARYPSHVTFPTVPMSVLEGMRIASPLPPGYPQHGDATFTMAYKLPSPNTSHVVLNAHGGLGAKTSSPVGPKFELLLHGRQ